MVPRLLLISDGNENLGSVARAIWQAQQLGIPIDTVALAGRPKPGLLLESRRHSRARSSAASASPSTSPWKRRAPTHADVELTAEGKIHRRQRAWIWPPA